VPKSQLTVTFLASHTDTGSLVTVNSGAKWGAGFTISAPNYDFDYFSIASVSDWPGSSLVSAD
jgi:hypothetical protein